MNRLVRISVDEDGVKCFDFEVWHLVDPANPEGDATLCGGIFFGWGESSVVYEEKEVIRGGITCESCMAAIKQLKLIRL